MGTLILSIQVDENGKKSLVHKLISDDDVTNREHEAHTLQLLDGIVNRDGEDIHVDRIPETGPLPVSPQKAPAVQQKGKVSSR